MKNTATYAALLLMGCLFSSCKDFSQIVEIDIPEHEPKLSTKLLAFNSDTSLRVLVSNSLGILESRDTHAIEQATVQLFRNEQLRADCSYQEGTFYYGAELDEALGNPGDKIRLEIGAPGFASIRSEQVIPTLVPVLKAEIILDGTVDSDGQRLDEVIFEFEDPPQPNDYYAVSLEGLALQSEEHDSLFRAGTFRLNSNDPSFGYVYNYFPYALIFSDAAFNGRQARISCFSYEYLGKFSGKLKLYHLSRDTYLYHRSFNLYEEAFDNPFAEPVIVHSNIAHGYGIFGVSSVSEILVEE